MIKVGDIVLVYRMIDKLDLTDNGYVGRIRIVITIKNIRPFDMIIEFNNRERAKFFKDEIIKIRDA